MNKYETVKEGRLRYISSKDTIIVISSPSVRYKLCRIIFGNDGSIYVPFPYFQGKSGVLSKIKFPEKHSRMLKYDIFLNDIAVSYDVKFAHHTSGKVHFSKTGEIDVLPSNQSFSLVDSIGHIFKLYVYGLSGFAKLERLSDKNMHIGFNCPHKLPGGVSIRAEWRRKNDILQNSDQNKPIGPTSDAIHMKSGKKHKVIFLGQPSTLPLQDKLLMITSEEIDVAEGVEGPTMVFLGGFDPHETKADDPDPHIDGALAFFYK